MLFSTSLSVGFSRNNIIKEKEKEEEVRVVEMRMLNLMSGNKLKNQMKNKSI